MLTEYNKEERVNTLSIVESRFLRKLKEDNEDYIILPKAKTHEILSLINCRYEKAIYAQIIKLLNKEMSFLILNKDKCDIICVIKLISSNNFSSKLKSIINKIIFKKLSIPLFSIVVNNNTNIESLNIDFQK